MKFQNFGQSFVFPKALLIFMVAFAVILGASVSSFKVSADDTPERTTTIVVPYTEHEWWLSRWSNNAHLCKIFTDHEGIPTATEIYIYCGESIYTEWEETITCSSAIDGNGEDCEGVYLHHISSTPKEKEITVDLPLPEAKISLVGCSSPQNTDLCSHVPSLRITAQEPLPNEHIVQIQGRLSDIPFLCQGQVCEIPLRATSTKGITIEFWADSSYGDSSKQYSGRVRVVESGVSDTLGTSGWYVDLISEGWEGEQAGVCAQAWEAFPPLGAPASWLESPSSPELLATELPFSYLAGQLIKRQVVDINECEDYGLLPNGYASPCGLEKARPEVIRWQNLFDVQIVKVAQENKIPSRTLKRIFAQESQFWPGVLRNTYNEYGLGQLTELGADTALLWNSEFFNQFCPLVLSDEACETGYVAMAEENQVLLRGAVLAHINAECTTCAMGIDLENVNASIDLFAQTLIGNCKQTGKIISDATNQVPGEASNYEDLWRFTLVNYHAGSGCLEEAVKQVAMAGGNMNWNHVARELETNCPHAVAYVKNLTQ